MMEKLVIGEDSKSEDSEIIRQLKEKFQSSERSIRVQILTILPQSSHCITQTKVDFVVSFYESDESSWLMPGMKDFVSVKLLDGKRVHIQKRLILSNLQELFQNFKEKHTTASINFSKFAELRPKYCILAGESGTHSVCICTIHRNIKLMLDALKLPSPFTTYQECLAWLTCNPATPGCHLVTLLFGNEGVCQ